MMMGRFVFVLFYIISGLAMAQTGMAQTSASLGDLNWQYRVLLIQDFSSVSGAFKKQKEQLHAARDELSERDLLVFLLPDPVSFDGAVRLLDENATIHLFEPENKSLQVVLIGKDGGVKLRQIEELYLDEIFTTIDGMPMRQQEMREKQ